jgi:thiamine pyrophosphate-dependent acetolactate synthase large subunit-like protein
LLGKAVLADDSPFTTDGIGHHGTAPSSWAMKNCDAVLIVGSTMPWFEYYPKPGQARGVQIDMKPDRIGLRYPVEIGLVGGHCRRRRICDADGRRPPFSTICQLRSSSSRTLPRSSSSKWKLGNPSFGCSPIGFVAFARTCCADGFRCERPEEIRPAIQAALRSPRPVLVEAIVDPDEKPTDPDELRI